uniref:SANT domain-containing protein n=1 Tax=Setaria digitata TaxID=48799 RepID=A0A915Q0T8_9BILA
MSVQPESEVDEEIRSEAKGSTSTTAVSRRRIIYRPFAITSQAATTTVTSTIRDTLIAVRDAVAASIMTTSSNFPKSTSVIANAIADTSTISINSSPSMSNVLQQHTVICSTNPETSPAAPAIGAISKVPRRWEQWNSSEINAFFEGIKLYGKDFEQMAKLMARRKLNKDKDQIVPLISEIARRKTNLQGICVIYILGFYHYSVAPKGLMAGIPRDVKELFILINGFEWKRRVCGKFDQTKFQQLVMEGSTYEKKRKKKQLVLVRTPVCPSLQKFFPSCSSSPLPSHIFLSLTPKTEADRYFVEQRGQNPLIRIRIAVGDQLSRIFSFLKIKWSLRMEKLLGTITKEEDQVKMVLYPDKTTRIGKIIVNLYEATPTIFSINRLIKELQRAATVEQSSEPSKSRSTNAGDEASEDAEISHLAEDDDGPFTINENKLRAGLTEQNVHKATVTELLVYSTGMKRMGDPEPWRIFLHLLDRGYGDSLCKSLADPQRIVESDEFIEQKWQERIRKRCRLVNNVMEQPAGSLTTSTEMETTEAAAHEMVEAENSAFMQQLESLRVKKRARPFHQRFPGKNSGIMQTVALNPASTHQLMVTAGYQLINPVFGPQSKKKSGTVRSHDQFAFRSGGAERSISASVKMKSHDSTGRIWSDAGTAGGLRSDDNSDEMKSGNNYFIQEANISTQPAQVHHETEARYHQLVNPAFLTHKSTTSTSSVQFGPSSDDSASTRMGHSMNNFVQNTNIPICSAEEMASTGLQVAGSVFLSEDRQSSSSQFVLPISDTVNSNNEHFMEDNNVQKMLASTESTAESSRSCSANDRSNPLSPVKESSLLRELHSAPSMDKSIEVMLQENSTECYRFVEQFASTMNSRSTVVSSAISAENEITRIAQQLAQSAGDALRSADDVDGRIRSDVGNTSAISAASTSMIKSVSSDAVRIRSGDDKEM